jgi:hypothetical protein
MHENMINVTRSFARNKEQKAEAFLYDCDIFFKAQNCSSKLVLTVLFKEKSHCLNLILESVQ